MLDKTRNVEGVIILKKLYSFLALPNSGGFVLKFPAHISLKKNFRANSEIIYIMFIMLMPRDNHILQRSEKSAEIQGNIS